MSTNWPSLQASVDVEIHSDSDATKAEAIVRTKDGTKMMTIAQAEISRTSSVFFLKISLEDTDHRSPLPLLFSIVSKIRCMSKSNRSCAAHVQSWSSDKRWWNYGVRLFFAMWWVLPHLKKWYEFSHFVVVGSHQRSKSDFWTFRRWMNRIC